MNRVESRLSDIFYFFIDNIRHDEWLKFIRVLGLKENEIQNEIGGKQLTQETKYKLLKRWKMFIGHKTDNEYEAMLQAAKAELDRGLKHRNRCPTKMMQDCKLARTIYSFIKRYGKTEFLRLARIMVTDDSAVDNIKDQYDDNTEEMKYQIVLKYFSFQGINTDDLLAVNNSLERIAQRRIEQE
ncbi:unnamed protein product [Clavelina lepadiformis]|uniref:Death domain-containing protein n=1 Tax=Clavelina lepadiformis TaxID=159417 RepID=A0ABP0GML1_CLALP